MNNREIEMEQRWVCIKNINFANSNSDHLNSKYFFKRFDYIDIISIGNIFIGTKKNGDECCKVLFTKKEIFNNFITQAEWREEQINLILEDD